MTDEQSHLALDTHGQILLQSGDYEGAVAAFNESICLSPSQLNVYRDRAQAFQYLKYGHEAAADLQEYRSIALGSSPYPGLWRILCRIGRHSALCWIYESPGNCLQFGICRRCGTNLRRLGHDLVWQHVRENNCREIKTCRRCGKKAISLFHLTDHAWGEWLLDRRRCTRCGANDSRNKRTNG